MSYKTLIEFGLSEKEAKMYIALLELEVAKISELAKKAGINRSSAYVILEELKKKELVSVSVGEGGIQKYIASSPDVLLAQADDKAKKQKNVKEKIEKLLPELKALHKETRIRPRIYVYTDKEAIKQGYDEIFDEQVSKGMKELRVFEDLSKIKKILPSNFIEQDIDSIKRAGVNMRVMSPNTKGSIKTISQYKKLGANAEFAIIPENKFRTKKGPLLPFSIYKDKIDFFTTDHFLVVIENQEIADSVRNLYDLAWEESKRLSAVTQPRASSKGRVQ